MRFNEGAAWLFLRRDDKSITPEEQARLAGAVGTALQQMSYNPTHGGPIQGGAHIVYGQRFVIQDDMPPMDVSVSVRTYDGEPSDEKVAATDEALFTPDVAVKVTSSNLSTSSTLKELAVNTAAKIILDEVKGSFKNVAAIEFEQTP